MIYEARHARGLNYGLMGACILLSILGFAAAGIIPTQSGSYPLTGGAIVAGCFAAAFVFFRRAGDRSVQARIGQDGVYARRFSAEPVPWDRIAGAYVMRSGIQRIIRFDVRDPATPAARPRKLGINTTFYDRGMDELAAAVREYRPDLGV
jgi:hypothetical protein